MQPYEIDEIISYIVTLEQLIESINESIDSHYKYGSGLQNVKIPKRPKTIDLLHVIR